MDVERLQLLIGEAMSLDDQSPVKVKLLTEAVRIAETGGESRFVTEIREALIQACVYSGEFDSAMVAFSRNLQTFESTPDEIDQQILCWHFKWIINLAHHFPHVRREQIFKLEDDMQRHYAVYGYSMRPVNYLRCSNAMQMGLVDRAKSSFELFRNQPRDEMADCEACELDTVVKYHLFCNRDEQALTAAEDLLSGRFTCAEVPEFTFGSVLTALMRLGRDGEAKEIFQRGYRRISAKPVFLEAIARHLVFAARTNPSAVPSIVETNLPVASASGNRDLVFYFYTAAAAGLTRFASQISPRLKMRMATTHECYSDSGEYDAVQLAAWFDRQSTAIAQEFNLRNGNQSFSGRSAEIYLLSKSGS